MAQCLNKVLLICAIIIGTLVVLMTARVSSLMASEKSPPKYEGKSTPDKTPVSSPFSRGVDRPNSIGIGLGETFLLGEFRNHGDDSITYDLLYAYAASYSFDFFIDAHRSKHKYQKNEIIIQGIAPGIKGKLYQFDNFAPFVLGGIGFYRPLVTRDVGANDYRRSEGKVTFGLHFGGGADLRLNEMFTVGLLGHFHKPFNIRQDVGPKVSGSYFKLMMTFMYSF